MGSAERVRGIFQKILQSNLTSLEQEIETMLHYTLRHDALEQTDNPRDKVHDVLGTLLDKGEEACQGLLDNLGKNQHLFPRISRILKETRGDMPMFKLVTQDLGLGILLQHKMTLSDFQSIGCKDLSDSSCRSLKDIPLHFLQHLMALNIQEAFRSFNSNHEAAQSYLEKDISGAIVGSVHPLDVLCGVLHCSDNFLRQEILKRMSMCQVPLPLLLPASEDTFGTFLLWAMRGITKSLSQSLDDPKGLTVDSIVNISLPVFSFVSLGDCRCTSIAKITNQILSATQQTNQNHHMQRMKGWGNIQRHISNGLVEISWYFPDDQKDLRPYEKPFAVANLHGDLQSNERQFHLLTQVSCAVFILVDHMTEQRCDLISHAKGNNTNCYFIVQDQSNQESSEHCSQSVLMESDEKFYEKLQSILKDTIQKSPKQVTLNEMSVVAKKLDFCCDENQPDCEYGRLHSLDFTNDLVNAKHKGNIKQQKHLKKQIAQIEKELCRLTDQGDLHTEDYKSKLLNDMCDLLVAQNHHDNSDIGNSLQYAFTFLNKVEQQYFLKWSEFHKLSTNTMSGETIQEDVICKMGQMYETEVLAGKTVETMRIFAKFPKAAVDLLLQGIPLQFIDGDTTSVHLQWVTDVLTELNTRTRGRCKIKVISILGVQGTGKTTLLNTMFGLQFPMDHRKGTRGAFMSFIKVEERDLGCDFLVVIDCEGLQASVEEHDHDNELATLVIGLSDIVIVNMALGRTSKMRNILQIVFYALLRMKGIGQKLSCLLVYQRMEGECSKEEPMIKYEEMPRPGKQSDISNEFSGYSDTIECTILKDYWDIPPLELKTSCYSEKVAELKRHLLRTIKHGSFHHVQNFAADIKALWNSVKHENHIFRFRNILEENVYTELYERFLELEWNLCRKLQRWWTDTDDWISSQHPGELKKYTLVPYVLRKLDEEVKVMEETLKGYFTDNAEDTNHIAKTFEAEFMEKVKSLKGHLESHYTRKCLQVMILKRGLANAIVEDFIQEEQDIDGFSHEGGLYWNDAVAKYQSTILKRHNIEDEFLQLLRRDMRTKGGLVMEWIYNIRTLSDHVDPRFTHDVQYDHIPWLSDKCNHLENCVSCHNKRKCVARFLLEKSQKYVQKMVGSKTSYDPVYGMEILNMVNEVIRKDPMPYTVTFELYLKLQILAWSAPLFQQKHNDFLQECMGLFAIDLNHQGAQVMGYLRSVQQDKRIIQKYCEDWLKPAVELKVKKMFKERLVGDYTNYLCSVRKSRRRSSEAEQGAKCIHHPPVGYPEDTPEDICNRYTDQDKIKSLLTAMITSVIGDIRNVLHHPDVLRSGDIGTLMAAVWSALAGASGVGGGFPNVPFNVTVLNVFQLSSYLNFFVQKLEKQMIKEFSSKNIEEHYMECPFLICCEERALKSTWGPRTPDVDRVNIQWAYTPTNRTFPPDRSHTVK